MVLVPFDHAFDPIHVGRLPRGSVAKGFVEVVPHAVRLDVRFVDHVEPELVAEVVPHRLVGIVRRADRVDVVPFHKLNILDHAFDRDGSSPVGIVFVPVHAFDSDGHAVHKQTPVFGFDLTEPEPAKLGVDFGTVCVAKR